MEGMWDLGFQDVSPIMENQMKGTIEDEMDTGIV